MAMLRRLLKLGTTKPGAALAIVCVVVVVYLYSGGTVSVEQATELLEVVEEVAERVEVAKGSEGEAEGTGDGAAE